MGSELLKFDRRSLVRELNSVGRPCQIVFVAACVTRIARQYEPFWRRKFVTENQSNPVERSVELLWEFAEGIPQPEDDLAGLFDNIERHTPDANEGGGFEEACSQYAALAALCALDFVQQGGLEDAVGCAEQNIDALDNLICCQIADRVGSFEVTREVEIEILSRPILQRELGRQRRDLSNLRSWELSKMRMADMVKAMRETAVREAANFLDGA